MKYSHIENTFDTHETPPQELETRRGKVNSISSELLRDFLHEDHSYFTHLVRHTLNASTHFLPDILEEASELRNVVTKLRHEIFYTDNLRVVKIAKAHLLHTIYVKTKC